MSKIISLDFHGVLDADPEFFTKLALTNLSLNCEIHVVSGLNIRDLENELFRLKREYGFRWTTSFSIETHLLETGVEYTEKNGNLYFPDEEWYSSKGKYCASVGCTIHFDDTPEYEKYFSTPFVLWK